MDDRPDNVTEADAQRGLELSKLLSKLAVQSQIANAKLGDFSAAVGRMRGSSRRKPPKTRTTRPGPPRPRFEPQPIPIEHQHAAARACAGMAEVDRREALDGYPHPRQSPRDRNRAKRRRARQRQLA